jgi:hypothetical protein
MDQKRKINTVDFADNPEAARYYSRALAQLATRLEHDTDRVSPGVIISILGLLCYAV